MNQNQTGKFIKELREEKGLTQEELAKLLNISYQSISKWERNITFPEMTNLFMLADIFEVSIVELVKGKRHFPKFKLILLISLLSIFILSIITLLSLYTYNNYDKNVIYEITSADPDYYVNGHIIVNPEMSKVSIDKIIFQNNHIDFQKVILKNHSIALLNRDKILYSQDHDIISDLSLYDFYNIVSFNYIEKNKRLLNDKFNDLKILIEYDDGKEVNQISINLKLKKIYSSNKLKY